MFIDEGDMVYEKKKHREKFIFLQKIAFYSYF